MRTLLAILGLLLVACGGAGADKPVGGRDVAVAIVDCVEPQQGWARGEIESFGWHVSTAGEVDVRCADTGDRGGQGEYRLGAHEALVDPVKAPGMFAMMATTGHELIHWRIYNGPHPEMATLHICDVAYNEEYPPGCAPGLSSKNALMSPGGNRDWDGDQETFTFASVPETRVTYEDQQLIDRALRP